MNKLLTIIALTALSATTANATPKLYGKIFLSVDHVDSKKTTRSGLIQTSEDVHKSGLNSNGSRLGLKGSESLNGDTDLIYKLEYGINVDDGSKKQFYSRDTYLGLTNPHYGTLMAGRLKSIDKHIDFADVLVGRNNAKTGPTYNKPRLNNTFAYVSPEFKGAKLIAMYGLDSDTDKGGFDNEDLYGVGVTYANNPVNLGATYISHGDDHHLRLAGGYALSKQLYLGGYYQASEFGTAASGEKQSRFSPVGDQKEHSFVIGAKYATSTPWKYYGRVAYIDNVAGLKDHHVTAIGGGAKYAFTKAATGHIYAGYVDSERKLTHKNVNKTRGYSIGTGLEYKF